MHDVLILAMCFDYSPTQKVFTFSCALYTGWGISARVHVVHSFKHNYSLSFVHRPTGSLLVNTGICMQSFWWFLFSFLELPGDRKGEASTTQTGAKVFRCPECPLDVVASDRDRSPAPGNLLSTETSSWQRDPQAGSARFNRFQPLVSHWSSVVCSTNWSHFICAAMYGHAASSQ